MIPTTLKFLAITSLAFQGALGETGLTVKSTTEDRAKKVYENCEKAIGMLKQYETDFTDHNKLCGSFQFRTETEHTTCQESSEKVQNFRKETYTAMENCIPDLVTLTGGKSEVVNSVQQEFADLPKE